MYWCVGAADELLFLRLLWSYRQVGLVFTHFVVLVLGLPPATFWAWSLVKETILSVDSVIFASFFFMVLFVICF
jgi:hypothetical protein